MPLLTFFVSPLWVRVTNVEKNILLYIYYSSIWKKLVLLNRSVSFLVCQLYVHICSGQVFFSLMKGGVGGGAPFCSSFDCFAWIVVWGIGETLGKVSNRAWLRRHMEQFTFSPNSYSTKGCLLSLFCLLSWSQKGHRLFLHESTASFSSFTLLLKVPQ